MAKTDALPLYGTPEWLARYPIGETTPVPPIYEEIQRRRLLLTDYTLDAYEAEAKEVVKRGKAGMGFSRMIFTKAKRGDNIQFGSLVNLASIFGCPVEDIAHLGEVMSEGPKRYMPIEFRRTIERFFLLSSLTALIVLIGAAFVLFYMELDEARLTILFSGGLYCVLIGTSFASRKGLVLPIAVLIPVGVLFGLIASLLSYVFVLQFGDDATVLLFRSPNYVLIDIVFTLVCALFVVSPRLVRLMRPMSVENLVNIATSSLLILIACTGWVFVIWQTLRMQTAF